MNIIKLESHYFRLYIVFQTSIINGVWCVEKLYQELLAPLNELKKVIIDNVTFKKEKKFSGHVVYAEMLNKKIYLYEVGDYRTTKLPNTSLDTEDLHEIFSKRPLSRKQ